MEVKYGFLFFCDDGDLVALKITCINYIYLNLENEFVICTDRCTFYVPNNDNLSVCDLISMLC